MRPLQYVLLPWRALLLWTLPLSLAALFIGAWLEAYSTVILIGFSAAMACTALYFAMRHYFDQDALTYDQFHEPFLIDYITTVAPEGDRSQASQYETLLKYLGHYARVKICYEQKGPTIPTDKPCIATDYFFPDFAPLLHSTSRTRRSFLLFASGNGVLFDWHWRADNGWVHLALPQTRLNFMKSNTSFVFAFRETTPELRAQEVLEFALRHTSMESVYLESLEYLWQQLDVAGPTIEMKHMRTLRRVSDHVVDNESHLPTLTLVISHAQRMLEDNPTDEDLRSLLGVLQSNASHPAFPSNVV